MNTKNANNETTQHDNDQEADDECIDTQLEECHIDLKRHRFAKQQTQRSIDYDEIVASSITYTISSASAPSSEASSRSPVPLHHGDIVQIISSWSTVNDGVIQAVGNSVSAVGIVNQVDTTGKVKAYFHCHNLHEETNKFVLVPCKSGKFDCTMSSSTAVNAISAKANDDGAGVCVKDINATAYRPAEDQAIGWVFERSTDDPTNPRRFETRDWRLCVYWDERDKSKNLYLAASRNGSLSLCRDDTFDDNYSSTDEDSLRNPKTYFYLYKKGHHSP